MSEEYMDRAQRIRELEEKGVITAEQSSRIRKGVGLMYARQKMKQEGRIE